MTEELTDKLFDIRNQVRELSTAEGEAVADFYMNYEEILPGDDTMVVAALRESIQRMESALRTFKALMKQVTR